MSETITSKGWEVNVEEKLPKYRGVGRSRTPSDFDDIVQQAYDDGRPRSVPFEDESDVESIKKEITKATEFFGFGKDFRVADGRVHFQVRDKRVMQRGGIFADPTEVDEDSDDLESE